MKNLSKAVEDYLKSIHQFAEEHHNAIVSPKDIAKFMGVAPGTVTSMLKHMDKIGLIDYTPFKGCSLTGNGRESAIQLVRTHRLIETFLVNSLQIPPDMIHEEAEKLEHEFSAYVIDKLDMFLGYPEKDPSGYPIPRDSNPLTIPILEYELQKAAEVVSVEAHSKEDQAYLESLGILPGISLFLDSLNSPGKAGVIRISEQEIPLSIDLLKGIFVKSSQNLPD